LFALPIHSHLFSVHRKGAAKSISQGGKPMNTEELNLQLYNKMSAEFEKFKEELLNSSPQEVLDRAYEYIIKDDIVLSLEYSDLTASRADALLKSENSLDEVYDAWMESESSHMDEIREVLDSAAESLIRDAQHQREAKAKDGER
jgi:hypothetical protein